ncbi:hypothetical protein PG984_015458 [Apiospora sp. TS-2023a]
MSPHNYQVEEPTRMMYRGGIEMFNNDLFSDAKVTAGSETWPVHKSIICPRSEYFRRAFTGPFLEATTNQVTIEGQNTQAVGQVIRYLYTGEVPSEDVEDIRQAVDLFIAADYFDIEYLKSDTLTILSFRIDCVFEDAPSKEYFLNDEDLDQIYYAACVAYTSSPNLEALREPIEVFLVDTEFLLCKDDRFMRKLTKIPEFSLALTYNEE